MGQTRCPTSERRGGAHALGLSHAEILSRYTELTREQKVLVQQLNLALPPQPPPRITAAGAVTDPNQRLM
jgi:hypothetical protein